MAGLGGGSSDAAAVLIGINELFELNIPSETLAEIGLIIGADVPFFLGKGAARVCGIGEELSSVEIKDTIYLALVKPEKSLSTVDVYKKYDELKNVSGEGSQELIAALKLGDMDAIASSLKNDLEAAAGSMCHEVTEAIEYLVEHGAAAAQMTGSGSCVFGVFRSSETARKAASDYNLNGKAYYAQSVKNPVEID